MAKTPITTAPVPMFRTETAASAKNTKMIARHRALRNLSTLVLNPTAEASRTVWTQITRATLIRGEWTPPVGGGGYEGANDALKAARAAGIILAVDGEDSVLEAASMPPAAVLDALSQKKAEIVALLRPGRVGWSSEDWQAFFDERAGIAEFDGGLPRPQAEAQAFVCCVVEWLN